MKKIITFFAVLLTVAGYAQDNATYTASNTVIANPERGLQKYSKTADNYYTVVGASNLDTNQLISWRTGTDKVTVLFRYFMLNAFLQSNISNTYLSNAQADFDKIRASGLKVIVRFSYTNSASGQQQPLKAQILQHIAQLAPLLETNKDVIYSHQCGFLGTYGEWWTTGSSAEFGDRDAISSAQWSNRKDVITAMLAATPLPIPLQVRYVGIKQTLYGTQRLTPETAYQNTPNARIGFYNDCFLYRWWDAGTYRGSGEFTNPVGTPDYLYLANETQYLPMTGETCGLNAPRTDGSNALSEMNTVNFSTLNRDYNTSVWNNWSASQYSDILKKMGYRFELISASIDNGTLSVKLRNTGYANVVKPRKAYIVMRSDANGSEFPFPVDVDVRTWKTGADIIFSHVLQTDIPNTTYSLYLNFPDPLLAAPAYSIQCANSGTWEPSTGYNNLHLKFNVRNISVNVFVKDNRIVVSGLSGNYTLKVYDLGGRLVSTGFDISGLAKGMYVVVLKQSGKQYKFKIIR